jgi:hypothetical protein
VFQGSARWIIALDTKHEGAAPLTTIKPCGPLRRSGDASMAIQREEFDGAKLSCPARAGSATYPAAIVDGSFATIFVGDVAAFVSLDRKGRLANRQM